eukprot:TRINITY_DN12368_c0_g1_i1.p1 TRINITY_DN12368_c0_g1~~TRINITY_DN12368_c0_g1_i1.p1  ORF type:complete len:320 (+),score=45.75 TRINITY_DN12368_c0_g1_i1:86-1045(+)
MDGDEAPPGQNRQSSDAKGQVPGEKPTRRVAQQEHLIADEFEALPEDTSVGIPLGRAPQNLVPQADEVADVSPEKKAGDTSVGNYCYLILFNLNKRNNLGAILRSAAAFGVRRVVLVGREGFKAFCKKSGQGAVPIDHTPTLSDAVELLRTWHPGETAGSGGVRICGVEILSHATSLHAASFSGHTAFMVGNERGGLTRDQIAACDDFVYIPQFGAGVGSLNVACACSVVLYQFTVWANTAGRCGLGVPADPLPKMAKPHGSGSFLVESLVSTQTVPAKDNIVQLAAEQPTLGDSSIDVAPLMSAEESVGGVTESEVTS